MVLIFTFMFMTAFVALNAVFSGWAFAILWGWFAVPIFGLPPLTIAAAIGVSLLAGYLTHQYRPEKTEPGQHWKRFAEIIGYAILKPLLCLAVGWVVKQWM